MSEYADLVKKMNEIQAIAEKAMSQVSALKIDDQRYIHAKKPIVPGIGCKFAYDANGLIAGVQQLTASDIPTLSTSKIDGLDDMLRDIAKNVDLVTTTMKEVQKQLASGKIAQTGTKVNCDEHGRVVSISDLLPEDVPTLPIDKIEGLSEILDTIRASITPTQVQIQEVIKETPKMEITMDDIPMALISRINTIETTFADYAPRTVVDQVVKTLSTKIPMLPASIPRGTYTKVTVNEYGVITKGEQLTSKDLPNITIDDITGLNRILGSKVDRQDLNDIQATLATLIGSSERIGDILKLKTKLDQTASDSDLRDLQNSVNLMKHQVETLMKQIPGDGFLRRMEELETSVGTLTDELDHLKRSE